MLALAKLADITIAQGATDSRIVLGRLEYEDGYLLSFQSPSVLDGGVTYTFYVSYNPEATTPVWAAFQSGSPLANVTVPAASCAFVSAELLAFAGFKITANGAVGANRTFRCYKHYRTND